VVGKNEMLIYLCQILVTKNKMTQLEEAKKKNRDIYICFLFFFFVSSSCAILFLFNSI